MPLSRRYQPEHPPGETSPFGMDFSAIIPVTVAITTGLLDIKTNTQPPVEAATDWTVSEIQVRGRVVYATLSGGKDGVDYILTWTAIDTQGNTWPRSGLILCAATS
ncbi:MAG TPA: hypothetical protein VHT52_20795 [Stellaceae bacterium]|jgi:hypothetical protein|nr:hypothetical protein [Stellaceae bacterium]